MNQLFSTTGEGWFETHTGYSANDIVNRLRKNRRKNKEQKHDIDDLINDVRMIKALEFDSTIDMFDWLNEYGSIVKSFSPSERDMKALRKFGDSRKFTLIKACRQWEQANEVLKMLSEFEGVWSQDEKDSWVKAMNEKQDAQKIWKSTLHQIDKLNDKDVDSLRKTANLLQQRGPMTSKSIFQNLHENKILSKNMTVGKLGKLIAMYGEELDIISGNGRSTFVKADSHGLILKDPFSYAAGFLDADGYISITGRGEPRVGFIATGSRGKIHCEHLRKTLECGILQLNQKVYKDNQRSQHRLQFYSKNDIRKVLSSLLPHLQMKKTQAKAVLAFIDEDDNMRKEELKKLVKYNNWSDDKTKADALLAEWGVKADSIEKWSEGL